MKTKISPAVVGMFVLGAFALALIALLSFGGVNFFSKPQRFVVYFNESIHGLDLGSPVKLRGVRVGRVVDLSVRFDSTKHRSEVAVVCELSRNMITDQSGAIIDVANKAVMQEMIDRGLRAQLNVMGLATGMLYVELDFYNPAEYPVESRIVDAKYSQMALVTAVPSAISEYQASLSEILSDLRKVDFAGISKEAKALLGDARKQINKIEVRDLITEWTKAAQTVRELAGSPELKESIVQFTAASKQLQSVLTKVDAQIDPTSTKLNEALVETKRALVSFNDTSTTLRRFINDQNQLGENSNQALLKISEAADAVQRLADFLERNPNALLSGRKKPE
jgi:paraquat-inducible protein B